VPKRPIDEWIRNEVNAWLKTGKHLDTLQMAADFRQRIPHVVVAEQVDAMILDATLRTMRSHAASVIEKLDEDDLTRRVDEDGYGAFEFITAMRNLEHEIAG
jgi:hypothetical protein